MVDHSTVRPPSAQGSRRPTRILALAGLGAACALLAASCSSGSTAVDGVTLSALCAGEIATIDRTRAPSGSVFLGVQLTVDNQGPTPVPLVSVAFGLVADNGLQYNGDARTTHAPNACDPLASVAPGRSTTCVVVFTVPAGARPTQLSLVLASGRSATVAAPTAGTSLCDGACVDLRSDPYNCGACGSVVPNSTCVNGNSVCGAGLTRCGGGCFDLNTDPNHCGACFHSNPNCTTGVPVDNCSPTTRFCYQACANAGFTCTATATAEYSASCGRFTVPLDNQACDAVPPRTATSDGCTGTITCSTCSCH